MTTNTTRIELLTETLQDRARQVTVTPPTAHSRSSLFFRLAIGAFLAFFTLLMIVRRNPRMERDVVASVGVVVTLPSRHGIVPAREGSGQHSR